MVAEAAHLWAVAELLSPHFGDPRSANLLAAARSTCQDRRAMYPAHPESTDANESATGECHQRPERKNRAADPAGDRERRARSREISRLSRSTHPSQPRGDGREPARELANRTRISTQTR